MEPGSGGQQLDPGYKVRAAATVTLMAKRKKKESCEPMHTLRHKKTSPRKKEEEKKPSKRVGRAG